jgi:putative ATP-dependent endonuclease of OLD family
VDNIPHTQISLVRKVTDKNRGFKTQATSIPQNFFNLHKLDEFKYYQFHTYRNSDFFYANFVILVESKNDGEVVKELAARNKINLDLCGISVVNFDGVDFLGYPLYVVKDLKIPYLVILDQDFFIPYINDKLDLSRDSRGLPKYKYEYKKNILINELIPDPKDRGDLLKLFKSNHSQAMSILEKHNVICMNYNLDMDLTCSNKALQEYGKIFNLKTEDITQKNILENYKNAIKRIEYILRVLKTLDNTNLPNSYKKIKNAILKIAKKLQK